MANNRLSMRKITEALRLHFEHNRTNREIAQAIGTSPTTVGQYLRRAREAGIAYPLPEGLDDTAIESRLFPPVVSADVVRFGVEYAAVEWVSSLRGIRSWVPPYTIGQGLRATAERFRNISS